MMDRYNEQAYRFGGRGRVPHGDRSPYRRPMGRGTLPTTPYGGGGLPLGGCGCGGLTRQPSQSRPIQDSMPSGHRQPLPVMEAGGCGCGRGHDHGSAPVSCRKLMEQIRAVDFALYEVILYLDVYPHSCDALETYHKLKAQREALRKEYENTHGPLTAFTNESGASWDWIGSPFPWEYGAE